MAGNRTWVLVIDDNDESRKLVSSQLRMSGFDIISSEDGEQALDMLKYCTPDCILLDILMPKMHGHAFLMELRRKTKKMPVIVLSGIEKKPELVATMENLGVDGWFTKPIESRKLARHIKEVVYKSRTVV